MGMLADFFAADAADALRYARRADDPDEGDGITAALAPLQYNGIGSLDIGMLWAILEGGDWNAKRYMPEGVRLDDEGEAWLDRFPDDLTRLLADADGGTLARTADRWAQAGELDWSADELRPLLDDLHALARRAVAAGKSVYLWGCL